jgi:nitrite reductase (NADH) small subunit
MKQIKMTKAINSEKSITKEQVKLWFKAAPIDKFPINGGACVRYKDKQIAVFNFAKIGKWYAVQNLCPHQKEMVLSRGMIGDVSGTPKVACPLHKKTFSLISGENLNGDLSPVRVYPVKVESGQVYIGICE